MNEHLELLRHEYLRLQKEHAELKREYDILVASANVHQSTTSNSTLSFVQKLIATVSQLFDKDLYSDITIHCDSHQLRAHKFVIASRTNYWGDLSVVDRIELADVNYSIGHIVLKWMYTDELEGNLGDLLLIDVLSVANKYQLVELQTRCEIVLIGRLDIMNCVKLYQVSEERNLERLKHACTQLFSTCWNDFDPELFSELPAPLLYRILKSYGKHLLHSIIRVQREDVLFLFFVEYAEKFLEICNEFDDDGFLPLDLALSLHNYEIASSLVARGANLNSVDKSMKSFLAKAIEQGNVESCNFINSNGGRCDFKLANTGESLYHILARSHCSDEMIEWFKNNLSGLDINDLDNDFKTPLLTAIDADNHKVVNFLLSLPAVDPNSSDVSGRSPLSVALFHKKDLNLANSLVNHGADVNSKCNGKYLVNLAVHDKNLAVLQFLCRRNANVNLPDSEGLCVLHIAASSFPFNEDIFRLLLRSGADPIAKAKKDGSTVFHYAVSCKNGEEVLRIIFDELKGKDLQFSSEDFNGRTALAKSVLQNNFKCAKALLEAGADINEIGNGETLLLRVLHAGNDQAAVFLLDQGADASIAAKNGKSCLHIAVESSLLSAVRSLCKGGADLNASDPITAMPPLWTALENEAYDIAYVLVEHGCNLEVLLEDKEDLYAETMLYRAIILGLSDAAIFLIENGCDVNSIRKCRKGAVEDLRTPLLACLEYGREEVAVALIKFGARIDAQDNDGQTPAHLAVQKKNKKILEAILNKNDLSSLLMRNRYGLSPLVTAMQLRNNTAAEAIVKAAPFTTMQYSGGGENLLHSMVKANDLESVLFLLALHFDVNVPTQNASRLTALHICAQSGSEMIMRNLLLAGAEVNALSAKGFTALHIAAFHNRKDLCSILLENGASAKTVDQNGNNALHAAASRGAAETVKLLLCKSDVDPRAVNKRQQTPLILIGYEVFPSSLDILSAFLSFDPDYPVDARDCNGNTLFLLAYMIGSAELCKAVLRCNICLAVTNNYGVSVFNFETPTKQLLFSLLDSLEKEPKWAEGENCSQCEIKFSLTMRRHHCRHCGRLVCARCSENTIPILKYDLQKAVRVCQICSDVLTIGLNQ